MMSIMKSQCVWIDSVRKNCDIFTVYTFRGMKHTLMVIKTEEKIENN